MHTWNYGHPWWLRSKESARQCRRHWFNPWVGKIPWRRKWQSTPVFLPGKSHWTEEPGGLQSMGSQRVVHEWVTKHHHHHLKLSFVFLLTSSCPYKLPIDSMPFLSGTCPSKTCPFNKIPAHFLSHTVVCLHSLQLTDANFKDHCPLFPTLWAILVQAAITNYCRLGVLNN